MKELEAKRKAAYAADEAFTAELARVYGATAHEERYRAARHSDPKVEEAGKRHAEATRIYLDAYRASLGD